MFSWLLLPGSAERPDKDTFIHDGREHERRRTDELRKRLEREAFYRRWG